VGGNVSFRENYHVRRVNWMKRGKKYQESVKLVDKTKLYDPVEAMELVQRQPRQSLMKLWRHISDSV